MEVGERIYTETTLEDYPRDMRHMHPPKTRRPASIQDWKFSTALLTAVSASKAGEVRYLICLERTA
jgi:hypothetical protein